jgi:hypothetical protein
VSSPGKLTVLTHRGFVIALALAIAPAPAAAQVLVVGPNVNLNRQSGYQAEEAVAINPTNPNQMFAWANDLSGNNRNSAAVTGDGGLTWTSRFTGGSDGFGTLGGDPSCTYDAFGNLYASSLNSALTGIVVGRSTNNGASFTAQTLSVTGLDQPTIKAGPSPTAGAQAVWLTSRGGGNVTARGATVTGPGGGLTFGSAITIPVSANGNFGDVAIGPGGKVAVAFETPSGGVGPANLQVVVNASGSTSGTFTSTGFVATNVGGFRAIPAQPSRTVDAEVGLAYDTTGGPHTGRLYMVYTDAPSTTSNDLNIFTRYSDTDGTTWSSPVRVNDDAGTNSQFFSKIAIDPTTGNVAVVWYDARNSATNDHVELWGSASVDGGQTFLPNVKISAGMTTGVGLGSGNELGDYLGLDFSGGTAYPVWADDSNSTGDNPNGTGNLDYYGARVTLVTAVPEPGALALLAAVVVGRRLRFAARRS